ncbi:MAG: hypothetical protein IT435_05515 [Phycisphaerales bacterium]|nr:hypothetical protein [Phycisphaerales bacterium]
MGDRPWCTRCKSPIPSRLAGDLCYRCAARDRSDQVLLRHFREDDTPFMFAGFTTGNTTTTADAPTLESLQRTLAELEARPKPAHWGEDLHVTDDFYRLLRERCKPIGAAPEWSLFLPGIRVIVDLEPGTEPPCRWQAPSKLKEEPSDGQR